MEDFDEGDHNTIYKNAITATLSEHFPVAPSNAKGSFGFVLQACTRSVKRYVINSLPKDKNGPFLFAVLQMMSLDEDKYFFDSLRQPPDVNKKGKKVKEGKCLSAFKKKFENRYDEAMWH